jgi:hypothetical protein
VADAQKPDEKQDDAAPAADKGTNEGVNKGTETKAEAPVTEKKRKDRQTGKKVVAGTNLVRSRIASLVWLVAVVCALFLAVGALLVALKANQDNAIVSFVLQVDHKLDLGVFSPEDGIFTPSNAVKSTLVNWGIAAIAYLVVGKILDRIIRP